MRQQLTAGLLLWTSLSAWHVAAFDAVCGRIEQLQKAAQAANPSVVPVAIPIKATVDCIRNISVNWDRTYDTSTMLTQMSNYLDFETTLDSLKDPPSDWPYPAHDLRARLAEVKAKVDAKAYANEYDFEVELFEKVFAPAHSGHTIFYPDLLTNPWAWSRTVSLVSVSKDGTSLPEIYFRDDILKSSTNASSLSTIDGVDAVKFIEDLVFRVGAQDPDASYNAMFYNKAHVAAKISNGGYFAQGGRTSQIYPGENTTYTFQNGTSVTVANVALLKFDFTGASDNYYFMNRYSGMVSKNTASVSFPHDPAGYPTPVIATKDGTLGGYYLQGDGLDDIAVLSVLSFEPNSVVEYQAVAETFLADAVRNGKKKLVIDLSANNGGYILSAYDLFRQIFPQTEQVGLTRFRNNKIQAAAVKINPKIVPEPFDPKTASLQQIRAYEKSFNYKYDLDQNGKHFMSAEVKWANHTYKESNFSSLISWDLNDPLTTVEGPLAFGTNITGYGNRTNFKQPFAAEDIIMLTDGFCASSCFLFSDFMKHQGSVKSIVVGGRPTPTPMQAVGGVKGGQLSTWYNLYQLIYQDALFLWQKNMSDTDYAFIKANWIDHHEFQGFTATAGVNLRDVVQEEHVGDGVPAQFVREDADCRLWYTREMVGDVRETWKKAAGVAWQGEKCVVGGLTKRGGKMGKREVSETPMKLAAEVKTKRVAVREETVTKDEAWRAVHGRKAFE